MLLRDDASQSDANREFLHASAQIWEATDCSLNEKLETFPKYVSREVLTKFIARMEVFKLQLDVPGSVVELGVARGASLFTWYHLSSILEPANYMREIIGFDTFEGIPEVTDSERSHVGASKDLRVGGFAVAPEMKCHLEQAALSHDKTRFLGHIAKVKIVSGDVGQTVPNFLQSNPHLIISLLHLDADTFAATKIGLSALLPRVPRGGIVIFDELNDRRFPGETMALLEEAQLSSLRLKRFTFCPTLAYWQRD